MAVTGPPTSLLAALAEMGLGSGSLLQLLRAPNGVTPNTGPNAGVPQNPPISLLQLVGAQGTGSWAAFKSGDAAGSVFLAEPAPGSTNVVSNSVTITATGGSGSYSYAWAFVSGDAGIAIIGGTTGPSHSWQKSVGKNNFTSAVWRCTVSDGVNTPIQINVNIGLSYTTDA